MYVEVKGTTSLGEEVILTANEVQLHTDNFLDTLLAIVHSISLDRSGEVPVATGGTLRIITPWVPEADAHKAIAYRYSVPGVG